MTGTAAIDGWGVTVAAAHRRAVAGIAKAGPARGRALAASETAPC